MASSAVDICNMALLRLGQKLTISALTEATAAGRACLAFYAHCRDKALASAPWHFAEAHATLTLLDEEDAESNDWTYVYALPADCLAPRRIDNGVRNPTPAARVPYLLGQFQGLPILLTDEPDAELVYTARIETVGSYDDHFVDALAWLLASELAMPLSVKDDRRLACRSEWLLARQQAISQAVGKQQPDIPPECEFITARG